MPCGPEDGPGQGAGVDQPLALPLGVKAVPTHPLSSRAGFARQGTKEKQLLKEGNAFNVSSFVLRAMMSGQYWPEGDEVYHAELTVPVLLVHGMHDKFVPVEEDQRMAEVGGAQCAGPCVAAPLDRCMLRVGGCGFQVGVAAAQQVHPHGLRRGYCDSVLSSELKGLGKGAHWGLRSQVAVETVMDVVDLGRVRGTCPQEALPQMGGGPGVTGQPAPCRPRPSCQWMPCCPIPAPTDPALGFPQAH